MANVQLLTYDDLILHLINFTRGGGQDGEQSDYRDAIQFAMRSLVVARDWRYFVTEYRLPLNPAYSTGTVGYIHTGSAYERELTLTDGTWPSWAAYGRVTIGGIPYQVEDRKSNSILTLSAWSNPGANVASGTSYSVSQTNYALPSDFRSIYEPYAEANSSTLRYVDPVDWQKLEHQNTGASGSPTYWTIMGDPHFYGHMSLVVAPSVSTAQSLRFFYQRDPRPLRYTGEDANDYVGTVTGTAGSQTVTGTDTLFKSAHQWSVIRFTDQSTKPTGLNGLNPFTEQKVILAVANSTSLTVDTPLDYPYADNKYTISDPIDVFPGMINALLRRCEYELAVLRNRDDVVGRMQEYEKALLQAMNSDSMLSFSRSVSPAVMVDPLGTRSPLGADVT